MINIVETDLIWNGNLEPLNKGNIDSIALHHMAHPTWDFLDVHRAHQNQGWAGIGYNWWVAYDGTIYKGRGFNKGAGVGGHNSHIISIGFQGDYHNYKKEMPKEQYEAGVKLIRWLRPQLPNLKIIDGHKRWNATACPGQYFPLSKMIEDGWKDDVKMFEDGQELEALDYLVDKGRITDKDYWTKTLEVVKNQKWLIIKWANDLISLER